MINALIELWENVSAAAFRCWSWLKAYWYIPVMVLGSVLAWIVFRRPDENPIVKTRLELDVIKAGAKAAKLEAALNTERAVAAVKEKYVAQVEALDEKQAEQAKTLEGDPAALAKFLVRAGRPAGRR